MVDNILSIYKQATPQEIVRGMQWYQTAHNQAAEIARQTELPIGKIVICIAALSPRNRWERNLKDAQNLAKHLNLSVRTGTFDVNKAKALRCLLLPNFDFENEVDNLAKKGYKVKSFARLIFDPKNDYEVCIDTHAISIFLGYRAEDKETTRIFASEKKYTQVCDSYRDLAKELDILPHQLQAITWVTWKRMNNL